MMKNIRIISLVMLLLMITMLGGCSQKQPDVVYLPDDLQKMDYAVSQDNYFDDEGNLLVTYDVAYSSLFDSGKVKYDENTVLLKVGSSFDGILSKNMKNAGLVDITLTLVNGKTSWYKATIKENTSVKGVIQNLRDLPEILVADYDYIYETETITTPEVLGNDRIQEQWSLNTYGIEDAWAWLKDNNHAMGGLSSVVVAVIDTGVDYTHPDLVNNMWTNAREIPGNNIDDDDNGYIDDVYGIDTIAHTSNPMDDHGHGTHVSGIIAGSNNNQGIVGIAYNAKIMAVKAGMASGYFTQSSIAEAIYYAYENGADVINMSFGGSAISIAVQDALMTAYTRSILVASAGNSGLPNEPIPGWYGPVVPNYPAALSYVVGVMSVNSSGVESAFSNWDSTAYNQIEYEIYAPGEQILSTLPNNQYASWSGTSMSAPFVSGVAALLRSIYADREVYTNKFIMGQLVSTSENPAMGNIANPLHNTPNIIDPAKALSVLPKPEINLYDYYFFDSESISSSNNGDGRIDAGETIDMGIVLRNRWGMSKNTSINIHSISAGGVPNPYIEFITDTISMDSIGTYSTKDNLSREGSEVKGVASPLRFKVLENTPNDYIVNLTVMGTYENALDENDETVYDFVTTVSFKVRKGYILPNIISEDTTLTKDNYYIIPNSMVVMAGATLRVEQGTNIQFWTNDPTDAYAQTSIVYLKVEGNLIVEGSIDEPVKFFPSQLMGQYRVEIYESGSGYASISHAEIVNAHINISRVEYTKFTKNSLDPLYYRYLYSGKVESSYGDQYITVDYVENSIFYGMGIRQYYHPKPTLIGYFNNNIFVNSTLVFNGVFENNVFLGNNASIYGNNTPSSLGTGYFNAPIFNQIVRNPMTGTSYVYVRAENLSRNGYARFAEHLGGHLAMFETEDEYNFIKNNMQNHETIYNYFVIGATVQDGQFTWDNGAPIGSFITQTLNKQNGIVGIKNYDTNYQLYITEGYQFTGALIEIPGDIFINQIILPHTDISIDLESKYQVSPILNPSTALLSDLVYQSSDNGVATVDSEGLVTPVSKGQATIYVYSNDYQVSAQVVVNVIEKIELETIEIKSLSQIAVDEFYNLATALTPSNTTQRFLQYSSSDESIISINQNGVMKGVSVGSATITVTSIDGLISDQMTLNVVNPVEKIAFKESIYVTALTQVDDDFLPTITPFDATNQNIIWESSNPDVAYVENNQLIKLKEGTTTILALIENTNLKAEIVVSVSSEYQLNKVVKMSQYQEYYIALLSDGNMYYWGKSVLAPKRWELPVSGPIKDYANIDTHLFLLLSDGTVQTVRLQYDNIAIMYGNEGYSTNMLVNISSLHGVYSSVFAIDSSGAVWAWGSNSNGQLGDGTKLHRYTPVQTLLNGVKDIIAANSMTAFLTNNNEVYLSGGHVTQYTNPTLVTTNVISISEANEYTVVVKKSDITINYNYDGNLNGTVESKYEYSLQWPSTFGYIQDGFAYIKGENGSGRLGIGSNDATIIVDTKVSKIANVEEIFMFRNNIFFQTIDGMFYGSGMNTGYQLGNLSNVNSNIPVQIFFGLKGNEGGTIVEDDNFENATLINDQIMIDFNEALIQSSQYGYIVLKNSQNQQLSVIKNIHLDKFTIKPYAGWQVGETYTLSIPVDAFTSKFMISNAYLNYSFTYLGEQTAIVYEGSSISNEHHFDTQTVDFSLNFTYAEESLEFINITVKNFETNQLMTMDIMLNNNILNIKGTLPYGKYQLVVPASALKDNLGGFNQEIVLNFEVLQTIQLMSTSHENGSTRMPVNQPIQLTYNVATEGIHFNLIKLMDEQMNEVSINTTVLDSVLTITPNIDLLLGMNYQIVIPEGALTDALGNLNKPISHQFSTYEPLSYIRSSITDNQMNVHPNQLISLFFNYIEPSTAYNTISIKDSIGNVVNTVVTMTNSSVSVKPSIALQEGQYQLVVPAGAFKDELGVENDLITITFSTIEESSRFKVTNDYLIAELREFADKGYYSNFYGNAILNNFNNTNVETWLRIQAVEYSIYNNYMGVGGNFWGTINPTMIERQIIDFDDFQSLLDVVTGEYLTVAPENTFPFVTNVEVYNQNGEVSEKVGNELITVRVFFNRDMNPNLDLIVKFGSSLPYGERQITGTYVTSRIWEGSYQLTTIIENGNQFFSISNGVSSDNAYYTLQPDYGRFRFEIDTTAAQALVMQAVANSSGIQLTWEQDDYDTLAGYNVYRSKDEFGYYQRLNSSVIPYDIKTYFDDTVEPGVVYYYNFTVVNTDLTESEPSGKVSVQSFDNMAPNIYHTPVTIGYTNSNLIISATIIDNLNVESAKVFYRIKGQTDWQFVTMSHRNDKYTAIIQSNYITLDGLEYYIEVFDGINYSNKGSSETPYTIVIQQAIDSSKLGDINDDGFISTLDALMMLQAINGRLNLTSDQFIRADLDKDNILEAWEVLRVLQYVSGKVNTIS